MMRIRGIVFILAAVPAWAFVWRFVNKARRSPFGYEVGSVVFHFPPFVQAVRLFALLLSLIGLSLLTFDFIRWIRKRRHDANG